MNPYNKDLLKKYFSEGFVKIRMAPTGIPEEAYVNIKKTVQSDFIAIFLLKNAIEIDQFQKDCTELANSEEELIKIQDMYYDMTEKDYNFFDYDG